MSNATLAAAEVDPAPESPKPFPVTANWRYARPFRLLIDWVLRIEAVALLVSVMATAFHNVSLATDVWYYHMLFAARLAGIIRPDAFIFSENNSYHFKGFPLVGEFIQGWLWRISGRPENANLFCFACIPLFAWFLKRRFSVPPHLSVLTLLAVPLIHIHASSALIDLPSGTVGAMVALLTIQAFVSKQAPSLKLLFAVAALVAFGANTKAFLHPILGLCLAALGVRAIVLSKSVAESDRRRYRVGLALGAALLPLLFATPLKNLVLYHNPYYPFQLKVFGHLFPGPFPEFSPGPAYLAQASRPVHFIYSLLEIHQLPYSNPTRWAPGQYAPVQEKAYLMGGYFGPYVGFHLVVLAIHTLRERSRRVLTAVVAFALITLLTSVLPQCHELRYYMYWILLLLSLNLWLGCTSGVTWLGPQVLGLVASCALYVVITVTRGHYVQPNGLTFAQLVSQRVNRSEIRRVRNGEKVCVQRYPYNLLWASLFYPPQNYVLKEALAPSDCEGFRQIGRRRPRRRR